MIHNISYINFTGNYPKTVYDQESLTINVSQDSPIFINVESNKNIIYNYENKIITLKNIISNVTVSAIKRQLMNFNILKIIKHTQYQLMELITLNFGVHVGETKVDLEDIHQEILI